MVAKGAQVPGQDEKGLFIGARGPTPAVKVLCEASGLDPFNAPATKGYTVIARARLTPFVSKEEKLAPGATFRI